MAAQRYLNLEDATARIHAHFADQLASITRTRDYNLRLVQALFAIDGIEVAGTDEPPIEGEVVKTSSEPAMPASVPAEVVPPKVKAAERKGKADVEALIHSQPDREWEVADVMKELGVSERSRATISTALRRLAVDGFLEVVRQGKGGLATVYRRAPNKTDPNAEETATGSVE